MTQCAHDAQKKKKNDSLPGIDGFRSGRGYYFRPGRTVILREGYMKLYYYY